MWVRREKRPYDKLQEKSMINLFSSDVAFSDAFDIFNFMSTITAFKRVNFIQKCRRKRYVAPKNKIMYVIRKIFEK